jgi:hypothetical protein
MAHAFERATSGRAKCRGCGRPIERGSLRFGERLPNPFAEGEQTLWFHPACAAYKRPEPVLEALRAAIEPVPDGAWLEAEAQRGESHRRLARANRAERAPSGRARCRSCREPIAKGAWRISLVYFEGGMFEDGGYIHAGCALAYLGTADVVDRLRHFTQDLTPTDLADLEAALRG